MGMFGEAMKEMCDSCPFGHGPKQAHMRKSLRRGRFNEICQSIWQGGYFPCHKTTTFDDEGELRPTLKEKACRGALDFVESASRQRNDAERRAAR